ncbi:MAG: bifunctional adenosylcobinamide kinase/adenosylcobinamide-phosphate guanylyltransferase [Dehalococcoidia bacterium]
MTDLTLVLGGARSGKSRYAESLAAQFGPRVLYLATAEQRDPEMTERVRQHQARRPASWRTVEAPLSPLAMLRAEQGNCDAVLIDCLSLWVSNLLLSRWPDQNSVGLEEVNALEATLLEEVDRLIVWAEAAPVPVVMVSNEVGLGVVPPYPLGRHYRDLLGRANQRVASAAARVYWMVAGLGLELKALGAVPFPRQVGIDE